MSRSSPSRRRVTGNAVLVAVLLMMLGLSAVLAYEAHEAARSELRSGERTLRAEAAFAAWALAGRSEAALRDSLSAALAGAMGQSHQLIHGPPGDAAERAAMTEFGAAVRRGLSWCACPGAAHTFFRAVRQDGGFRLDTLEAAPGIAAGLPGVLAASRGVSGRMRAAGGVDLRFDTLHAGGRTVGVAYAGFRDPGTGLPQRLVGFVYDPSALAGPVIGETVARRKLLPPALQGKLRNESTFRIAALTRGGDTIFRAGLAPAVPAHRKWQHANDERLGVTDPFPVTPEIADTLRGTMAGTQIRLAVHPEAIGLLISGRATRSRLPLLAAVFLLTLGLVAVAIAQLRRQHELERLRDDFVSGVSHELRTPLAQIRLFADLLESGRLQPGAQESRSVRIINEEAQRLTYLVENVLHFSRGRRHAEHLSPEPTELAPLVREIVDAFAPLARTRGTVVVAGAEDGIVVPVDRDALRQVLLNLLDNAVKYGPRGQQVRIGVETTGPWAVIHVDDQGPGIPPEERARIWEPYRRLERDARGAAGGCGIGLSVVRELVDLHGGRAAAAEAPGGGARFTVALPGATRAPRPASLSPESSGPVRGAAAR